MWSSGNFVIVELLPEACEQSGETGADATAGHADGSADLIGGEASRVAQRDQGSIVGLEARERVGEVEDGGAAGRVDAGSSGDVLVVLDHGLAQPASMPAADQLLRLVRGDRHEPRSKAIRVPDRAELRPGLLPGGLDGLLGN